ALTDIDFTAAPGHTIGIIGATGSGKSTLINLIPGFYEAGSGQVLVGGKDVREYDKKELRSHIGLVPQNAVLFAGTIRDNLLWGKGDASDSDLAAAVSAAQAADIIEGKEAGLDEMVEQGGRNFSGGQRQRLTIARALVRRPEILILDDSSSALDYATDAALRKAIAALDYHPTVFIVSQRTSSIRHADQIIVLDDGRVAGLGTHDELMKSCEIYRQTDRIQFPAKEGGSESGKNLESSSGKPVKDNATDDSSFAGSIPVGGEVILS
ncbi:MAG: ABC transporter ATP-binding protein/permease, partial [Clostridiales bacterium]|nr:ABC transporter ATP-binding protein/permease [Clostridiales bacterium]